MMIKLLRMGFQNKNTLGGRRGETYGTKVRRRQLEVNNMKEKWKPINGFEDYYLISNRGRVTRIKDDGYGNGKKFLKPYVGDTGYHSIQLWKKRKAKHRKVHLLVLENFGPKKPGDNYQCNHKNGKKADNHIENLEWLTQSENTLHRCYVLGQQVKNYTVTTPTGEKFFVKGLKKFCRENNLDSGNMCRLATNPTKYKSYRGWRCRYASI